MHICMPRCVVYSICLPLLSLAGCSPATPPATQTSPVPSVRSVEPEVESVVSKPADEVSEDAPPPVTEAPKLLDDIELTQGWISLFDGETLYGWTGSHRS